MGRLLICGLWVVFLQSCFMGSLYCLERVRYGLFEAVSYQLSYASNSY